MDDEADDWCAFCGEEACEGECQPTGERPGALLERRAKESRDEIEKAVTDLALKRLFPEPAPEPPSLKQFEQEMARRPKVELARRADGTTYRKRT